MKQNVSIIGGGFSGLTSACYLAIQGYDVSLFEKNESVGGRARTFTEKNFTFDMGPSWYWMPDVFEDFFNLFGKSTKDYFPLQKLDPGFQIFFENNFIVSLPADMQEVYSLFENIEKGSSTQLKKFLSEAEYKYKIAMKQIVQLPSYSWFEYVNLQTLQAIFKMDLFSSMHAYVRKYFKNERLIALMEFPVLFLGAMPKQIPALYSLMNYSAISQGTFYPMGGMTKLVEALEKLALSLGVHIHTNCVIEKIIIKDKNVCALETSTKTFVTDALIASADYQHVEMNLLKTEFRNYDDAYWNKKTFAPSALIFYLGVNKKIKKLIHHNLFFDTSLNQHSKQIYSSPQWPTEPLFYVCCPSKTDVSVAPLGMENLFILIPIATNLEDNERIRETYLNKALQRLEKICDDTISEHIIYKRSYCIQDFKKDYNAYKGNAYGLANILKQTGPLKPCIKNKKLKNMFYAGQLTVPGPGVPPAFISGQVVAKEVVKILSKKL